MKNKNIETDNAKFDLNSDCGNTNHGIGEVSSTCIQDGEEALLPRDFDNWALMQYGLDSWALIS